MDTYRRAWVLFRKFSIAMFGHFLQLPLSVTTVALFVAHLHCIKLSNRTISTYLSAVAYAHKLLQMPDPTANFLITTLIRGSQRLSPSYDLRLPITVPVLNQLIRSLGYTSQSFFHRVLYTAMFLFAFSTFARCGEIAFSSHQSKNNLVQFEDVHLTYDTTHDIPTSVNVVFRHFKHNYGKPHEISFSHGHTEVSPVSALATYLKGRGTHPGPLFSLSTGSPVPRSMFDGQLRKCLQFCGLDCSRYKSHSFRIGKASDCAQRGHSDAYIKSVGRWHSNAFQKYIRIHQQ